MLNLNLPNTETEHLLLREIAVRDADDMFEYASDPENCFFVSFPLHRSVENTREIITNVFLNRNSNGVPNAYAIVCKTDGKMIGTCDFHRIYNGDIGEIGFIISKKYWGRGYASEACLKTMAIGFEYIGLRRIEVCHSVDNIGSGRVIQKCGFIYEGTKRRFLKNGAGVFTDHPFYSLLREEYTAMRAK